MRLNAYFSYFTYYFWWQFNYAKNAFMSSFANKGLTRPLKLG
ncbi:hypothetical protein [Psittacicella gerlachiana]|nr:hypothetical protein [Psittacicella gerlachiana]